MKTAWWRRTVLLMTAAAVALLPLVWVAPMASAQTQGKLLLLMDASGSMKEKAGSQTKIAIAKQALSTVISKLPADAQAGMRVYGATVFSRKDKGACADSQLVVPIGTGNRDALKAAIARYKPYGETPISYSLTQAAKDLGSTGRRTVVLVSDGEETCNVDPCVTAANLAKQGIDLKFDVIGLNVSGKSRSQLQCIADKGHGTYYDADNSAQIVDSLEKLATRAYRPFKLTGTPIQGGTDPSGGPVAKPGQYLDRFPGNLDPLYYRIPRTVSGSTIHVGFTADAPGEVAASLNLSTAEESFCGWDVPLAINTEGATNVLTGEVGSYRSTTGSDCNVSDTVLLKISRGITGLEGRPFELLVTEEPPVADAPQLPPASKEYSWQTMSAAKSALTPPVPGSSVSDAPILAPGTYRTTILTGEKQVYGVNLGWGQRLQAQVVVAPRTGALAKALGNVDTLNVQVLSPMRGTFINVDPDGMPTGDFGMYPADKTYRDFGGTPPVTYLNRAESDSLSSASQPGTYSVVVNKSRLSGEGEFLVPYTLIVKVIGTAGTGAPQYQTMTGASSATPTPTPTPTPSVTPTAASTTPTGGVAPPQNASGLSVAAVVAIAVGALVVGGSVAAVVTLLLRRRRSGSSRGF